MIINPERANKILRSFKLKFPELTVLGIYTNDVDTLIIAVRDPEKTKHNMPYFLMRPDGLVTNAHPIINKDIFDAIYNEDHRIYVNTDF